MTPTIQAGRTGGAGSPGTETYNWGIVSGGPAFSLNNPANSSSQIVRYYDVAPGPTSGTAVVRVRVTDSAGNYSEKDITVSAS